MQVAASTAERLAAADRYDEAVKLAQLSFDAARQLGDPELIESLGGRARELAESQARFIAAGKALAILRKQPTDPLANQQAGEWYWYDKHDRDRGFGYLAHAANDDLRAAVVEDQAAPNDPPRQFALANAWWSLAQAVPTGNKRSTILGEALRWYKKVQGRMPDPKLVIYDRIVELERECGSHHAPPLVVDLGMEAMRLPIGDEPLPAGAALEIEIVELAGLKPAIRCPAGPQPLGGGAPFRLPLRTADPRVEIRFQADTANGKCVLVITPVYVEGENAVIPFTNARIDTLAARLPDQAAAEGQRLAAVTGQIQSLRLAGNALANTIPGSAAEALQKTVRLQEMQNDLKRLVLHQSSVARAWGRCSGGWRCCRRWSPCNTSSIARWRSAFASDWSARTAPRHYYWKRIERGNRERAITTVCTAKALANCV